MEKKKSERSRSYSLFRLRQLAKLKDNKMIETVVTGNRFRQIYDRSGPPEHNQPGKTKVSPTVQTKLWWWLLSLWKEFEPFASVCGRFGFEKGSDSNWMSWKKNCQGQHRLRFIRNCRTTSESKTRFESCQTDLFTVIKSNQTID